MNKIIEKSKNTENILNGPSHEIWPSIDYEDNISKL
jgi:hypothetical protein